LIGTITERSRGLSADFGVRVGQEFDEDWRSGFAGTRELSKAPDRVDAFESVL
jgi:hypothetical protein